MNLTVGDIHFCGMPEPDVLDMIANWWEKKITQAYNQGKEDRNEEVKK